MSLNVYLRIPGVTTTSTGICIREDGRTRELTREEWNERFPDTEPVTVTRESNAVFDYNITHNLNTMAREAGIYEALWRPEEIDITTAEQLIEPLRAGLKRLQDNPDHYCQFNPGNGWGSYEGLVKFVEEYLAACIKWPMAEVEVWR
jgi:hypothetical protein